MLCDAAWARDQGNGRIHIPARDAAPQKLTEQIAVAANPGMPITAVRPPPGACGACSAFHSGRGWCNERKVMTGARDHACSLFIAKRG